MKTGVKTINDYKAPLKTVFGYDWEGSNEHTEGRKPGAWTDEDLMRIVKLAYAGVSVHDMADLLGRTAYAIELRLGKIAVAILDGGNAYGTNSKK